MPRCEPFVMPCHPLFIEGDCSADHELPVLPVLLRQEAEARHGSEKVSPFQSYKYDNTIVIDVLTILLYTSSATAELALTVTVPSHASES